MKVKSRKLTEEEEKGLRKYAQNFIQNYGLLLSPMDWSQIYAMSNRDFIRVKDVDALIRIRSYYFTKKGELKSEYQVRHSTVYNFHKDRQN